MLPNEGKVSQLTEDKKEMLMAEKYLQFMVSYDMSSGWQKSSSCIKYLEILVILAYLVYYLLQEMSQKRA